MNYKQYRRHLDLLMEEDRTTGRNQEEWRVDYARLNISRMQQLEDQWQPAEKIEDRLLHIETPLTWLTFTEGWSGEAAHIVPVIDKLASINPLIEHRLIVPEEEPEKAAAFLNPEHRAIPTTVFIDTETKTVWGQWGPRPLAAEKLIDKLETKYRYPREVISSYLHNWYQKDKGAQTASEFVSCLEKAIVRQKAGTPAGS